MKEYRNAARNIARETSWTFMRFLPIITLIIIVLFIIGFGLRSLGYLGGTIVERKVLEQSYQRSESLISQIAVDEAMLAEITNKLKNPNLDDNTKHNLRAQASAARMRIATARSKQK